MRLPRLATFALPPLALALALVAMVPAAAAAPLPAAAVPAASAGSDVWAWGAFENATYTSEYVGAYADLLNLTGGNISAAGAFVAEVESLHAEYGAFTVINGTAPTATTRSLESIAIAVANYSGGIIVVGDLPAAGTYAPGAVVPLVNTTSYYVASILEVSAYVAFTNYTLVNGTLSLTDEHLEAFTGVNTTIIAYDWPTVTNNANGTTTVAYTTAGFTVLAWVGENVSATFTPAVPLAVAPLSVGETWNATTQANVTGWAAYAAAVAYATPNASAASATSGVFSLNASVTLAFDFAVVGSETVLFPNGTQETGYLIAATEGGSTSGYVLWDGLAILPVSGTPPAATLKPATLVDAEATVSSTAGPATQAVVTGSGLPVATHAEVAAGTTVETAPMSPDTAQGRISTQGTPARPAAPTAPSTTSPPVTTTPSTPPPASSPPPATSSPGAGTPPTSPGTTTTTPAGSASHGFDPYLLVAILAVIGVAFLGVELFRERRRR